MTSADRVRRRCADLPGATVDKLSGDEVDELNDESYRLVVAGLPAHKRRDRA
ncbi:MAG: hypothetical protein ACK5OX_17425 [Desertimonas sp.]